MFKNNIAYNCSGDIPYFVGPSGMNLSGVLDRGMAPPKCVCEYCNRKDNEDQSNCKGCGAPMPVHTMREMTELL